MCSLWEKFSDLIPYRHCLAGGKYEESLHILLVCVSFCFFFSWLGVVDFNFTMYFWCLCFVHMFFFF